MIVINGRYLSQRMTGIQRFAYEISNSLIQIADEPVVVLAPQNIREEYDIHNWDVRKIGGKGSHFWEQLTLSRYMKKHFNGEILLHLSGLGPIGYTNNVMTIHDVSYLIFPRSFSWTYRLYYRFMTPIAARRAKHILIVSEFSKREIIRYLHIDESKISVVYNAVHSYALAPKEDAPRYILSVCNLSPRKNLRRLIEAYLQIPNKDFDLYLIGGGDAVFSNPNLQPYQNVPHIHFLGYVDNAQLRHYYRNAIAFISPSLYEGFGIPNIEAMQQKCAIAVSDIPAYHEVCGDAAVYFDPLDEQDIRDKMVEITHNEALRSTLIEKGDTQLQRFSWEQSARQIIKILVLAKSERIG